MPKIVKRGKLTFWIDGEGIEVPEKYIRSEDKARDALVSKIVSKARLLQATIQNFKAAMDAEIADFLQDSAARQGEAWVGGTTLYNFAMDEAVRIKIHKKWQFDEKLNIAKQKIDKCIESWSGGSNEKLVALVNRAFQVDGKGEVDPNQILGLRQFNFDDDLWIEAMELIAQSQKVQSTKTYFYCMKAGPDGKMITITLDFAAL